MKETVNAEPALVRELIEKYIPEAVGGKAEKLVLYYEMLIEWNNRMNLTAITDPAGVVLRHFADSLIGSELISDGAKCIDVGTGAGFPGLPLKIMRPDIELTLLDSLNKRINFLTEITKELGLRCELVHARAEDGGRNSRFRERFDFALSRAVASANILAEWTLPFVKMNGLSLMYKGPSADEELKGAQNAFQELNSTAEIKDFAADWGVRKLIVVKKHAQTPQKYPRKAGTAERNPL